jgi:hypothetical protein
MRCAYCALRELRYFDFDVASGKGLVDRCDDSICHLCDTRPARRAQDYDRNMPGLEILLIPEVAISRHQDIESGVP